MKIVPSGQVLGASVEGLDLGSLLSQETETLVQALGKYSVLRFPKQTLSARQLRDFAARFGELEINVASGPYQEPGIPEVMTLSNIVENGRPLGIADAGQDWHTDMSYSRTIAFANVLYGIKIPRRNGRSLGNTEFCSMHAAYDGLPSSLKNSLASVLGHDAAREGQQAAAAHRGAEEGEAAGVASRLPYASDHRAQGFVRQPRLFDAHQ